MMAKQPKILLCPAHYVFDGVSRGSELSWAYHIADGIARHFPGSLVVTGFTQHTKKNGYQVVQLQKNKKFIDLSLSNSLLFNFFYSSYAAFSSKQFDVHHHILPFMIGTTFNLFWALGIKKKRKTIVGPLQMPIPQYQDNVHDFNHHKVDTLTQFFSNVVLTFFSRLLFFLSKRTLLSADMIIVIDQRTRQSLMELGVESDKITVIPPGVDTNTFTPSQISKKPSTLKLLTVSQLISRKRVELLLHAVAQAVQKNRHIHLEVVGVGPQEIELKKLSQKLQISEYVTFSGFVQNNEVHTHYQQSDVFITASAHESWGQMYLEAMSAGLPIITTKNHGAQNIVQDNAGVIVEATASDISKAILAFARDNDKMIQMSKSARATAIKKHDWDKVIIPQYINLYTSLFMKTTSL